MNNSQKISQGTVRSAWIKPEIKRIEAGSAERAGFGAQDGSTTPGSALS